MKPYFSFLLCVCFYGARVLWLPKRLRCNFVAV